MKRHVSAEVLARYQEGDLGPRRSARVADHLSGCGQCARTGSDLTAVSGLLAGMGQPAMPAALAERLSLAIARESAIRSAELGLAGAGAAGAGAAGALGVPGAGAADSAPAGTGEGAAPRDHIPGRPDLPERSAPRRGSRPWLRWPGLSSPLLLRGTAAIAVVIVLAGAGFLLARGTAAPPSAGTSSGSVRAPASGAGGGHKAAESRPEPAGVTGTTRLHYRLHGKVVTATALASHMNFTRAGLSGQVHRAMASQVTFGTQHGSPYATPAPGGGTSGTKTTGPLLGGVRIGTLNGCLSRVSAGRRVVLTEIARYLGRPATIIVLKSLTANILDVAIVGLACSASAPDYIVQTTVPAG